MKVVPNQAGLSGLARLFCFALSGLILLSTTVAASDETAAQSCEVIVKNPKARKVSQEQCECVLGVYQEMVKPEVLAARVAYFKARKSKIRSKVMFDLFVEHGAHEVRANIDKAAEISIVKCGSNMDYFTSKQRRKELEAKYGASGEVAVRAAAEKAKQKEARKVARNKRAEERKARKKKHKEKKSSGAATASSDVVTRYSWPGWWKPGRRNVAALIEDLENRETVDTWMSRGACELNFRKFEKDARHYRVVRLKKVVDKTQCTLKRPEIEKLSFGATGIDFKLPSGFSADDAELKKNETTRRTGSEVAIFGDPIAGLKQEALSNCDATTGLCTGDVTVAFYNGDGQFLVSQHRMMIFKKDMPLAKTPVKNSAKRLFPSGTVPANTLLQRIRSKAEWMSGGKFQADSCNALWVGEDTLKKPDKLNWGCGYAEPAWKVQYRILQ